MASSCQRRGADPERAPEPAGAAGAPSTATLGLQPAAGSATPAAEEPRPPSSAPAAIRDASAPEGVNGAASSSCVNGWSSPPVGSPLRKAALDMMRASPDERFVVTEIRYFVGPEDAEVIGPRREVERWYVKAFVVTDPKRRQRWLVRRAAIGSGVDAVAPYDSRGYGPGTWRRVDATDESVADPFERPCNAAAPGEKCMGLPREVLGCLEGT